MTIRWISAGVGIPIFIGICIWGPLPFAICILFVAVLGLIEMVHTYRSQGTYPNLFLAAGGLLGPAWAFHPAQRWIDLYIAILLTLVLLAILWEVARAATTGEICAAKDFAYGLLCCLYIALFSGMPALRSWPGVMNRGIIYGHDVGLALVIVVICCVWATDSAAFFVGKYFGKHKLAPALSPGKTVEGSLGGLLGGVFIGGLFGYWFLGDPGFGLAIGAVAGFFGQVGDLFESALKREAGVKDFGNVMPGHGGAMDRFDSLLVVAPLIWLLTWVLTAGGRNPFS